MTLQAKIVRQEGQNIDALYEKKRKQAETGQKMYVPLPRRLPFSRQPLLLSLVCDSALVRPIALLSSPI